MSRLATTFLFAGALSCFLCAANMQVVPTRTTPDRMAVAAIVVTAFGAGSCLAIGFCLITGLRQRTREPRAPTRRTITRAGYTLVEMLVAVALVVLIMSLFAEIFGVAAHSISTQRGIAANDQAVRTLTTVIRADLDKRTFRTVVPFYRAEASINPLFSFGRRTGFFYVSENDPDNHTDDVLHFTVRSTISIKNKDESPYYGSAVLLTGDIDGDGDLTDDFLRNPNQPEADDGQVREDGTSTSPAAEICYFLRNGILYRRTLLIRDPLPLAGADAQPTNTSGKNFYDPDPDNDPLTPAPAYLYTGEFWTDFDFSAYRTIGETANYARFNGHETLDNSIASGIGQPFCRFGHDHVSGLPHEFLFDGTFIGRYTKEETSHYDFDYPQRLSNVGGGVNPMTPTPAIEDADNDNVVDQFRAGTRRGEDILLTNVHSFDVKVWDDDLGKFVDIGHDEPGGDFSGPPLPYIAGTTSQNLNTGYGPTVGNRFDTWHPHANVGDHPDAVIGDDGPHAPYRCMIYHCPGSTHFDAFPAPPPPPPSPPLLGVRNFPRLYSDYASIGPTTGYQFQPPVGNMRGDFYFPEVHRGFAFYWECLVSMSWDADNTMIGCDPFDPALAAPTGIGQALPWGQVLHRGLCDRSTAGYTKPGPWGVAAENTKAGQTITFFERDLNSDGQLTVLDETVDTQDYNGDGDMDDTAVEEDINGSGRQDFLHWIARKNWMPLRGIQIKIRFQHVSTGQMRQLTLMHSLMD